MNYFILTPGSFSSSVVVFVYYHRSYTITIDKMRTILIRYATTVVFLCLIINQIEASFGVNEGPVANKRERYVPIDEGEIEIKRSMGLKCMKDLIKPFFNRYITNVMALQLMAERNVKTIVETGTSRILSNFEGDGCFTVIFGCYAKAIDAHLTSVDISQQNCDIARAQTESWKDHVDIVHSDSLPFLENWKHGPIDFLYLDSYDYESHNPDPSQQHHLREIQAVYDKLHSQTVVMIDDCRLIGGGKCLLVRKFLLERGWKAILLDYQEIYVFDE